MRDWSRWSAAVLLFVSLGLLFHRLLMGEVIFWGTPLLQFYPWETAAFNALRAGRLPLWNPLVGNGAPLLANYQTAVLYPPNWLYLLIPVEYGMGLLGVSHLLWAGAGMMAYLRRLRIGILGQGLGGIGFALSGYLISRFGFPSIIATVAWLPWLMWAIDGLAQGKLGPKSRWKRLGLLAGVAAMQLLAGHAQTAFYSMLMAIAYVVWRAGQSSGRERAALLVRAAGGLALGGLIAAAQLLPTAELMLTSQRAGGVDREAGLTYSFWPWRFLTLVAPNLFGSPAAGNFDGYAAYWEDAIYVGLLTLVMSGHGMARWLRERAETQIPDPARVVPFFAASLPIVFVFALGKNSPVFAWLFDHNIPGFVTFQGPTRWTILAEFALCTLAAVGVDAWKSSERGLFWTRLLTAGGGSFIVASLLAMRFAGGAIRLGFIPAIAWLGGTIILVGAVSLLLPQVEERPAWRPWWELAVLAVLVADLTASHWGLSPTVPASYYHQPSTLAEAVRPLTQDSRTVYLPDDEYQVKFKTYLDFKDFHPGDSAHWDGMRSSLLPNLGMLDGIPSASNFDPLLPADQSALVVSLEGAPPADMVDHLRRMNIGVLLTARPRADLQMIARSGPVIAYQVPDPWPRALIVKCTGAESQWMCEPLGAGEARIVRDESDRLEVATSTDGSASLLVIDTYYPGWMAAVDGAPVAIRRANRAFRAVDIPAGSHWVVFSYAPQSLFVGAVISGAGLITLVWVVFWKSEALRPGEVAADPNVSGASYG